jgi:hypothetical protein
MNPKTIRNVVIGFFAVLILINIYFMAKRDITFLLFFVVIILVIGIIYYNKK